MGKPPIIVKGYLIVRADGTMRTVTRPPRLSLDEVAFPVTLTIPRMWGQVQATKIDLEMPEPPESRVTIGDPELLEDEA